MRVYNAFLMPFDSLKRKCPDNSQMLKIGEAISNWKDKFQKNIRKYREFSLMLNL